MGILYQPENWSTFIASGEWKYRDAWAQYNPCSPMTLVIMDMMRCLIQLPILIRDHGDDPQEILTHIAESLVNMDEIMEEPMAHSRIYQHLFRDIIEAYHVTTCHRTTLYFSEHGYV